MRFIFPCLLLLALTACTSQTITSETLSESEISAIRDRAQQMHPELSDDKQHAVTALAVRAIDNMVFVEGGSFMMGEFGVPCEPGSEQMCNSDSDRDNDHAHKVTLDDYYLAKYESTLGDFDLYREVQGKKPYALELRQREDRQFLFETDKPAWTKNWKEAQVYCQWIGKVTGRDADLPTEAQWEYAARNRGKKVRYATDNGEMEPGRNYPSDDKDFGTMPVGSYPPNPLGLHDMAANAGEWMRDWYSPTYYRASPELNPQGPETGEKRVFRNISSGNTPETNTTIDRSGILPEQKFYGSLTGFRCMSKIAQAR